MTNKTNYFSLNNYAVVVFFYRREQGKLGELHVTLCYQPTAECIYVIIGKARGLKAKDINGLSGSMIFIVFLFTSHVTLVQERTANYPQ